MGSIGMTRHLGLLPWREFRVEVFEDLCGFGLKSGNLLPDGPCALAGLHGAQLVNFGFDLGNRLFKIKIAAHRTLSASVRNAADCLRSQVFEQSSVRALNAVARILLSYIRLHRFCRRNVGLAGRVLILQSCQTTTIQRKSLIGIQRQRRAITGNRRIELGHPQENNGTAIERCWAVALYPQSLVAIGERLLDKSYHGASPATIVKSRRKLWSQAYGLVEVVECVVELPLGQIDIAAIEICLC